MSTDLFSLAGKNVLITGAGGVIGGELTRGMTAAGAIVGAQDLTLERAQAAGGAFAFAADLSEVEACRTMVAEADAAMGGIDVLVNCAGINRRKSIDEVTAEDFDAIAAVNMRAVFFTSQAVHPIMTARGGGTIVNISSMSARFGYNTISVYAATKAAVTSMTRSFAREWVKDGIRVNCIEPSVVKTEFTKPLWGEPHRERWFADNMPMGRLMDPPELVGAVIFLASGASSYITGQSITIDGGLLAGADWDGYAEG